MKNDGVSTMGSKGEATVIVGAQWGDEGKGKWVDIFAEQTDMVVRFQGGNNAGHTLYVKGEKVVLHQVPSGVFRNQIGALASGVVINPSALVIELDRICALAKVTPQNLWISARAHVITPWHIHLDGQKEAAATHAIGTTRRGIGPTYSEKAARTGLRMGHYIDDHARGEWLATMMRECRDFQGFFVEHQEQWTQFAEAAQKLRPFVCDAENRLRQALKDGKKLLLEGAQGTLLDLDHGTYPFVTSSSTSSAGACTSIGVSPKSITKIIGIAKAYATRVGAGPFPTELFDDVGKHLGSKGKEFGATTGRPRRCGWFDGVAMRYCMDVNGFDGIVLNKMDILTGLPELKVAVAYQHPSLGRIVDLPWDAAILSECKPIYVSVPGWEKPIPESGGFDVLPREAVEFIKLVEDTTGVKVLMVGTGPERHNALFK